MTSITRLSFVMTLFALTLMGLSKAQATTGNNGNTDEAKPADSVAISFAATISEEDLLQHLSVLASDEYEGRETGFPGQRKAADYIAAHFKSLGLPPIEGDSYFQPFYLEKKSWNDVYVMVDGQKFEFLKDFYCFQGSTQTMDISAEEIVFLGYGISDPKYDDYAGMDVQGKVGIIYGGEPMDKEERYHLTGSFLASDWTEDWERKVKTAKEKGLKAVLIIDPYTEARMASEPFVNYLSGTEMELVGEEEEDSPYVSNLYISQDMANALLGKKAKKAAKIRKKIDKKFEPASMAVASKFNLKIDKSQEKVEATNVLGFLEGTDLKDEIVVVTAHYDHIGRDGEDIFNGADDDGSGTVAVLEIAEAMVKAAEAGNRPRRSVLFMTVSGEEKGLLGSSYYTDHPVYPLENTVCDLNIDMVGRIDAEHEENPDYVYIIGSDFLSTDLHDVSEWTARTYTDVELDYKYNSVDDPNRFYFRSDHYNFAKNNIPVIFYFNGTHDDYHQATDTVDKIDFDVLAKRSKLIFHTLWELANMDQRVRVDKE